jgi:hypothetical protein
MGNEIVACKTVVIAEVPAPPITQPTEIPWWAVAVAGGMLLILLASGRRR